MRVTQHNGRTRKSGKGFDPAHNDRTGEATKTAANIDRDKSRQNMYWAIGSSVWYSEADKGQHKTFAEAEADFYETHFRAMYDASVERSRKRGQMKRVKPFDVWRQARQYVPEESYLQVGKTGGTVAPDVFQACAWDYVRAMNAWNKAHGRPFTVLDAAFHFDEAVPQLHIRRVWHSVDPETGIDEIGQEKALERAGVQLPNPAEEPGKTNNRKMVFDAYMREQWVAICKARGLDITDVPEQGRPHNQTKQEWLDGELRRRAESLERREQEIAGQEKAVEASRKAAEDARRDADQYAAETRQKAADELQKAQDEAQAVRDGAADLKAVYDKEYADTLKQAREDALKSPLLKMDRVAAETDVRNSEKDEGQKKSKAMEKLSKFL